MDSFNKTVFAAASVGLPPYKPTDSRWKQWSVIACDQFTSEPFYWEQVQDMVGDAPSAYRLMLPEAYLGTGKESAHGEQIAVYMNKLESWLNILPETLVYLERTLPDGSLRPGLVGALDLEEYDYRDHSTSFIRATEATVLERIPPRCKVRQASPYEMPHVMVFYTDPNQRILQPVKERLSELPCLYRTELMLGGGFSAGYAVRGTILNQVIKEISSYEKKRRKSGAVGYAIGDGNHSLAAAKAYYENMKKQLGEAAKKHPSRYALAELVCLEEKAIEFEPIYRLITNCRKEELLLALASCSEEGRAEGQYITAVSQNEERTFSFQEPTHSLTVGTLQDFLDSYVQRHPETVCDYIHGEENLRRLASAPDAVGFLFQGVEKDALFPYVEQGKVLPRKTFSMGEAKSKRYYMELRKIKE